VPLSVGELMVTQKLNPHLVNQYNISLETELAYSYNSMSHMGQLHHKNTSQIDMQHTSPYQPAGNIMLDAHM